MNYNFSKEIAMTFYSIILNVKDVLQSEGFGVMCVIDVKEKFKEKLFVDF